jgi:hypothetical protein
VTIIASGNVITVIASIDNIAAIANIFQIGPDYAKGCYYSWHMAKWVRGQDSQLVICLGHIQAGLGDNAC